MTRKKRRNADNNIRKLERAYRAVEGTNEGIPAQIAYWRALLKTGQLPEPTGSDSIGDVWVLGEPEIERELYTGTDNGLVYTSALNSDPSSIAIGVSFGFWDNSMPEKQAIEREQEAVKKQVVQKLLYLMDSWDKQGPRKENPRRKNSDDSIRGLQRAFYQDPSIAKQISYWLACLRAGKTPEPSRKMLGVDWYIIDDRRYASKPVVADWKGLEIRYIWSETRALGYTESVQEALQIIIDDYLAKTMEDGLSLDYWYVGP